MMGFSFRKLMAIFAVALTLGMLASTADARVGGGFSMGSRGSRTFSAPPTTRTAPTQSAPIQRSITQPSTQPRFGAPASQPGFFGRGLLGGLAAGFIGAGLFGLLFGHGLFGGLGGFASILGLILQIGLIVLIARFLWSMWQRRQPAYASGPAMRDAPGSGGFGGLGGFGFGGGAGGSAGPVGGKVDVTPADFDAFERLLGEIQADFSNEDLSALRGRATPEMLSYFSEQLSENVSRGVVNKISNVKLLQGDLAEAWSEGGAEYATVAMRFALIDRTIDRASGRLVDGSDSPQEITELWTFMRSGQGNWLLSAIQQT
jgi:predicted lipid-binding transport protein (Tim44 family)